MSKRPANMFTSYEDALVDLYPRLESHYVLRQNSVFAVLVDGPDINQIDRSHARDMINWFSRTSDLPRPWPQEYQDKLFMPRSYLPPNAQSLLMANNTAAKRPRVSPLNWYKINDIPLRRRLAKILVRDIGVPPYHYLSEINATLLGASAYTNNLPVLKIMLDHCSPPESRLITLRQHLKENPSSWLIESTLLHRVVSQYSGMIGNDEDDMRPIITTVDMLTKHDPECLLARNINGHLPEEMDQTGDVGNFVELARKEYTSSRRHAKLKKLVGDKRSTPKNKLLPKI